MTTKAMIDCKQIKPLLESLLRRESSTNITQEISTNTKQERNGNIKYASTALEFHEGAILDKTIMDIRTFICTTGKCKLNYNRSHRRMSSYNWKKIENTNIKEIAEVITREWELEVEGKQTTIGTNNRELVEILRKIKDQIMKELKVKCDYYCDPGNIKHSHFVKDSKEVTKRHIEEIPIESVFTEIDRMAEENNIRAKLSKVAAAPGKPILQSNNIRMHYGDINYLGSNKALFYFDRGIRGIQIYTNSMYPLKQQPPYKDLVVIDEIVFTSSCKCDSSNQHKEMFPHYRVTCAVGLTCPARLNNIEKIIYTRDRNATTQMFTTAKQMLIRYW